MLLLIGLGNPTPEYKKTRHNVGEMALRAIAGTDGEKFRFEKGFRGEIKHSEINGERTIFLFPHTFMNQSGEAAELVRKYYHIPHEKVFVLHDELDLPFGSFKLQFNRGPAGHNGVQSIMDTFGTKAFWRLRIGIGPVPEKMTGEKFVLGNFTKEEVKALPEILKKAAEVVLTQVKK